MCISSFHCAKFKKNSLSGSRVFPPKIGPKMVHFPQTRIFWEKSLILFSSTYWPLSLCKIKKKKKKKFNADPELSCDIFGPKMVHLPKQEFFLEIR